MNTYFQTTNFKALTEMDVRREAERSARKTGLEADDLFQEFYLILVEQAEQFSGANRSYILQRLAWEANHLADKDSARTRLNQPMVMGADGEGEEEIDVVDEQALTPEAIIIARQTREMEIVAVKNALMSLTPRQTRIARSLMQGARKSEIAARLGISKALVSREVGAIRSALAQ